jgi:hypothetical protein
MSLLLGHNPPRWPSACWWVLTTANAAGINGLTCLLKHRGARDIKILVTHPMIDQRYLTSAIALTAVQSLIHSLLHFVNVPVSGVTTCFLLPLSSITRHLLGHSFYSHVILHTVHPSFLRATSARVPIHIHTHHSFRYMTFIHLQCYKQCVLRR